MSPRTRCPSRSVLPASALRRFHLQQEVTHFSDQLIKVPHKRRCACSFPHSIITDGRTSAFFSRCQIGDSFCLCCRRGRGRERRRRSCGGCPSSLAGLFGKFVSSKNALSLLLCYVCAVMVPIETCRGCGGVHPTKRDEDSIDEERAAP